MKMLDSDLKLGIMFEHTFHDAHDGVLKGVISTLTSPERGSLRYKMTRHGNYSSALVPIADVCLDLHLPITCRLAHRNPKQRRRHVLLLIRAKRDLALLGVAVAQKHL